MKDGATQESTNGWTRFYFPLSSFDCTGSVKISDLNRVQWENRGPGRSKMCVKNIRIVPQDETSSATAGR